MSISRKAVIIIVSIIVVLFVAFTTLLWMIGGELFFMAPSYNKMDKYLKANIDELSYVSDALIKLDYDSISIRKEPFREEDKYTMRVSREHLVYETIPIPDELLDSIQNLYESGVEHISCGRDFVSFTTWSFMGEMREVIYSRTGRTPDGAQLIEVRQLSKENWYYCVDNFEKARVRNPERFM